MSESTPRSTGPGACDAAGRAGGSVMRLGVFSYNVAYGARPDELARAAEERRFESFWVGEHTHIPAARADPVSGG